MFIGGLFLCLYAVVGRLTNNILLNRKTRPATAGLAGIGIIKSKAS